MLGRQAEFKAASEENEKLKVILKLKLQTVEEENKRLWRLLKLMQSPVASHTIELSVLPDRPVAEGSDIEAQMGADQKNKRLKDALYPKREQQTSQPFMGWTSTPR